MKRRGRKRDLETDKMECYVRDRSQPTNLWIAAMPTFINSLVANGIELRVHRIRIIPQVPFVNVFY